MKQVASKWQPKTERIIPINQILSFYLSIFTLDLIWFDRCLAFSLIKTGNKPDTINVSIDKNSRWTIVGQQKLGHDLRLLDLSRMTSSNISWVSVARHLEVKNCIVLKAPWHGVLLWWRIHMSLISRWTLMTFLQQFEYFAVEQLVYSLPREHRLFSTIPLLSK